MKIKIFTEGGKNIGYGHINRCYSLAQAFEMFNDNCDFYIACDESILDHITDFTITKIDWISKQKSVMDQINISDILIFDTYKAPSEFFKSIAAVNKNLVFFDDYNRVDYPEGLLINGALNADNVYLKRKSNLYYLLGAKYQTVRKEFWNCTPKKKNTNIEKILITFGGDDSRNLTPVILQYFSQNYPEIFINIIVGKSFTNTELIENKSTAKTNIFYNPNANQICELMKDSDIAICGAGQTLSELARLKTPALFIGIAKNQNNNIISWDKFPCFKFVGWWNNKNIIVRLHENFTNFKNNFGQISNKIYSSELIIDGQGSINIVREIRDYVTKNQN